MGKNDPEKNVQDRLILWRIGTVSGVVLYAVISFGFIFLGRPNADEGWYLLASRLVLHGQIPYRDFAYTQMPLMPYIYGIPQILFPPSVILGRATSVVLSTAAFAIWLFIAKKRAGIVGVSATALLLATFTYGLYYNSIVKTYALVTLFFALTFLALTADVKREWVALAAAAAALGAVMVRLSALPFTIVIVAYLLVTTPGKRAKWAIGILCALVVVGFLFLVNQDILAARWNLVSHHTGYWEGMSNLSRLNQILTIRAPELLISFLPYLVLLLLSLVLSHRRTQDQGVFRQEKMVFVVGVTLFGLSHFATGAWHTEYFVPAVYSLLPVVGMSFAHAYYKQKSNLKWNVVLRVILFSLLISEAIRGGGQFVDLSGGQSPMVEIREVSSYVQSQTLASERIIVFEALSIAIDSNRRVLPGMTMAQFSLYDGDADEARQLKLVNSDILLHYLRFGAAKIVVFSDLDWANWRRIGIEDQVKANLDDCYDASLVRDNFGQYADHVYVYTRLDNC